MSDADDPFDAFNRAQGQGQGGVRDPYPLFAAMRAQAPVQRIDLSALGVARRQGVPEMPKEIYAAVSYEAVAEVLRDGARFSSAGYARSMGVVMGHTILEMDEPEHATYRKILQQAFSRKALERWEHELVAPVIHACVDAFCARGRADLVRELTFPFPVAVIAGMIGVPDEDRDDFHRWAIELISVGFDWERGLEGSRKLGGLFRRLVAARRRAPRDDLVSVLAGAEVDGERMGDDAIVAFLRLLAPAGAETTYRSSSNLLFALLSDPAQMEALRADRSLLPRAIEEGLRWEPPLTGILRTATRDTEVAGVPVPAGAAVSVQLGAANRDPACYADPDRFDLQRTGRTHMAFAFGVHRCLGMHLARLETRVLLEALLDRLPDLRLDPDAQDVHISGMVFRSPLALPVRFTPSAPAGGAP